LPETYRHYNKDRRSHEHSCRTRFQISQNIEPAAESQEVTLEAGESRVIRFDLTAPEGIEELRYTLEASTDSGASDRMAVTQRILPAVPVRTMRISSLFLIEKRKNTRSLQLQI
jgi:hypothetical protein